MRTTKFPILNKENGSEVSPVSYGQVHGFPQRRVTIAFGLRVYFPDCVCFSVCFFQPVYCSNCLPGLQRMPAACLT